MEREGEWMGEGTDGGAGANVPSDLWVSRARGRRARAIARVQERGRAGIEGQGGRGGRVRRVEEEGGKGEGKGE